MTPQERRTMMLKWRLKGRTIREISKHYGVSDKRVRWLIGHALADLGLCPLSGVRKENMDKARIILEKQ